MNASYAADLELAHRCAAGEEPAWERFVLEYRPVLYRAADALDPTGGARDLADAIYADLYSQSLFRYYQGRSSLATWLRAVLSQRYVDRLDSRGRLRLGCYYVQELTLAEIGRLVGEHEATVSRQLARTRRALREDVERQLRIDQRLSEAQVAECFAAASEDAGLLDLGQLLGRKKPEPDRSI